MARGGADRPPYPDAIALGLWGWENRAYVKGLITLRGGNCDALTLRQFLDATYAVLVEGHIRNGVPMWEALQFMEELRAGKPAERQAVRSSPARQEAVNDQSLAELEAMLRGAGR